MFRTGGTGPLPQPAGSRNGRNRALKSVVDFPVKLGNRPLPSGRRRAIIPSCRETQAMSHGGSMTAGQPTAPSRMPPNFVFVLYFLAGHLADVLPLHGSDVIRPSVRFTAPHDWCAAAARRLFGRTGFHNLLARAFAVSNTAAVNSTTWRKTVCLWRLNVCCMTL